MHAIPWCQNVQIPLDPISALVLMDLRLMTKAMNVWVSPTDIICCAHIHDKYQLCVNVRRTSMNYCSN